MHSLQQYKVTSKPNETVQSAHDSVIAEKMEWFCAQLV